MLVSPNDEKRTTFFRLVFGQNKGIVCLAFLSNIGGPNKKMREQFFSWPDDLSKMLGAINDSMGENIYFCPQLLMEKHRRKELVSVTPNLWADLDTCHYSQLLVEPSIVLESSPDRFQALWILDRPIDPDDAEDLSRRIAYKHAHEGADRSGWDLSQLLRVPFTYNYKYASFKEMPEVAIVAINRNKYRPSDFHEYPEITGYLHTEIDMPGSDVLNLQADDILQEYRMIINPLVWQLYNNEPVTYPDGRSAWSEALWNLEILLFEAGMNRNQVYCVVREAKCNKYARDGKPARLLWKDVCRAEAKAAYNTQLLVQGVEVAKIQLMTDEERSRVDAAGDTFVERYITWASSLGDAAPQYHQAGAFIALSALLSGCVRLPTSYGTVIPNLWFMILADTTLTRKTTAMDIATDLVVEIDDDAVMATDGSLEGLLQGLSMRPGKPSIFLRDEFSGLLEAMTKKDYMAGMAELLTKLYDGKFQKRILRKEIVEVRNPRLIIFAGGIKDKITSLLTYEHVASGFMPRFIFITAVSDIKRLKPVGPPTVKTTGSRDAIMNELTDISKHYSRTQSLYIEKLRTQVTEPIMWDLTMSEVAWVRYNQLETSLVQVGLESKHPDVYTPLGDRLSKSILKAAMLLACARTRDEEVVIEEIDILRAIKYGEAWRTFAQDVMDNVGKGPTEKILDSILRIVDRDQTGTSRSKVMQYLHLSARDTNNYFETLEQRGLITRTRSGRTELLLPTVRGKK